MNLIQRKYFNSLSFLVLLVMNFLGSSGYFNGETVQAISIQYSTLFTPADYTFVIWGIIYVFLVFYIAFQWYAQPATEEFKNEGVWFGVSNLANGIWIVFWVNDQIGWSVLCMFLLLYSLIQLTVRMKLEIWDAPVRIIFFVWWPICFYLGWMVLATVANVASFLVSLGWFGTPLEASFWAIFMIVLATIIYLMLIQFRCMREAALVGAWGLIGLAVKQWNSDRGVCYAAVIAAIVLIGRACHHAWKNRETSPFRKLKRGEF